jgi:hypothetical protein
VHGTYCQKRRNGCVHAAHRSITEDQDGSTAAHGIRCFLADAQECAIESAELRKPEHRIDAGALDVRFLCSADFCEIVFRQDGLIEADLPAVRLRRNEQVLLATEMAVERGDEFLPNGVKRRVRNLSEQLSEVIEQQPRALGEHRKRRIVAHGPDGFCTHFRPSESGGC